MTDPVPVKASNTAATVAITSAIVGFFILPLILAPAAIVAGAVALQSDEKRGTAWTAIVAGILEIGWIFVKWSSAGLL